MALGALAQLVERLLCKQDVGSSILPGSTRISPWLPTSSSAQGLRSVPVRAAAPAARSSRGGRSSCLSARLRRRAAPRWSGPLLRDALVKWSRHPRHRLRVVTTCRVRGGVVARTVVCGPPGRRVATSRRRSRGAWRDCAADGRRGARPARASRPVVGRVQGTRRVGRQMPARERRRAPATAGALRTNREVRRRASPPCRRRRRPTGRRRRGASGTRRTQHRRRRRRRR